MADKAINKEKRHAKLLKSLKPVMVLHLFFGYDYGLFGRKSVILARFINVACALIAIVLTGSVLYLETRNKDPFNYYLYPIQYLIEAMTTIFIFGPKILSHLNRYEDLDERLGIDERYYAGLRRSNIAFVTGLLLISFFYMTSLSTDTYGLKISCIFLFLMDVSFVLRFNFFNLLRYRVMTLRRCVEQYYNADLYSDDIKVKEAIKIHPDMYVPVYKFIADQMDDFNRCIGFSFLFCVAVSLWKFIVLIYDICSAISTGIRLELYFVIMSISLAVHTAVFLGLPGIVGEITANEVNQIKLTLANKLCRDPDEREEKRIKVFLEYINVRPMCYWAWRILPVNAQLIGLVGNFCTTVLILMMQMKLFK